MLSSMVSDSEKMCHMPVCGSMLPVYTQIIGNDQVLKPASLQDLEFVSESFTR